MGKGAATVAKNDYFVVVYRILTYLYQCFMAGEKPDAELFGPEALGINNGYWVNVMESIYNEGYITGIAMVSCLGAAPGVKLLNLKITQKGIEYLQENSKMHKAAEFLKTVKEIVPGF